MIKKKTKHLHIRYLIINHINYLVMKKLVLIVDGQCHYWHRNKNSVCQWHGNVVVLATSCAPGCGYFQIFQQKKWPLQIIFLTSWTKVSASDRWVRQQPRQQLNIILKCLIFTGDKMQSQSCAGVLFLHISIHFPG